MIEGIARVKGVFRPVIPFGSGRPVVVLRRIPVGQRADGVGNGILVLHIARSGIHRNPAGVCDRVASIRTAEQVFSLHRLVALHLAPQLKLLRAMVVILAVEQYGHIFNRTADFYIARPAGTAAHAVADQAVGAVQGIQRIGRIHAVGIRVCCQTGINGQPVGLKHAAERELHTVPLRRVPGGAAVDVLTVYGITVDPAADFCRCNLAGAVIHRAVAREISHPA